MGLGRFGRRASRGAGGRLASLGQDHTEGHLGYVASLPPGGRLWLRTKPFSAPPNDELARCLHSFSHIVGALALPPGAEVLDVGCGPGWLSEMLARCGYAVTGVDVSPDMVSIARERIEAIPGPVGEDVDASAEFHAMPVTELPWTDRFDAAVLYDAMHHFHDERATLAAVLRALAPGGRIYIHEGIRPAPGSAGERELIEEMERYGTLEAPFDPGYLAAVLRETGFEDVRRLVEIDALVDVSEARALARQIQRTAERPVTNTFIGAKPVPEGSSSSQPFLATISQSGPARRDETTGDILVTVTATNSGRASWPAHGGFPYPRGTVTVAPFARDARGGRVEMPRVPLPHSVRAGETVDVLVRVPSAQVPDDGACEVDMVREGMFWFGDTGSPTGRLLVFAR